MLTLMCIMDCVALRIMNIVMQSACVRAALGRKRTVRACCLVMALNRVVSSLQSLCADVSSLGEGTTVPRETLESFGCALERAYRELVAYEIVAGNSITQEQSEAIDFVRAAMRILRGAAERAHDGSSLDHSLTVRGRGRPRLIVTREQLESVIEATFTTPQIAHMLGVSVSTVRRRMDLYNLCIRATYAAISDHELDQLYK